MVPVFAFSFIGRRSAHVAAVVAMVARISAVAKVANGFTD
ncbi:hypothetical protein P186_1117 [Pyrobaculum ferrireducens]|uniref:Uncharacterized protein n=1 Tax=Pyrobaculum ferrireducens TaxID=1104324 RepID=G7VCD0_9CREN|nr:hypothetical protein P186_1117 [Pyrobaculum ferrireducens]